MYFVTAQQDNKYMLWQLYVQMSNFRRLGIEDKAIVLIGYDHYPSPYIDVLRKQTSATVIAYPDDRVDKSYTPSIYFHLVSKFLSHHCITEPILFHDNDVIFRELPDFNALNSDDVHYFSDCTNYLSHSLYCPHNIGTMAQTIGMTYDQISCHMSVGGAQYLFKSHDANWWKRIADEAPRFHQTMVSMTPTKGHKRPDPWMAGMWLLQWSLWREGVNTQTHPELNFTWPTYSARTWTSTKILHNAGVMPHQKNVMFHKGSYVDRSPFRDDLSFVSRDFASWYYAQEVLGARAQFDPRF